MGMRWDTGETAFAVEFWAEALRVLKPGGHVAAFGGTRSQHRLVCAIEDAGFEIRDQIQWIFSQGFPKSHSLRDIGRPELGTALKPAHEPICLARKPLSEKTVAANVLRWGTGAINVDGCRVSGETPSAERRATGKAPSSCKPGEYGDGHAIQNRISPERWLEARPGEALGRFPANLCHDGSEEVLALFPESNGQQGVVDGNTSPRAVFGEYGPRTRMEPRSDTGSAARFFYTAKADGDDRIGSKHPTVKPLDLMQWLVRLVTPWNGVCLDPFAGTGTTGEAAWRENATAILIEREVEYLADIARRMEHAMASSRERSETIVKTRGLVETAGPLFAGLGDKPSL